ncbi:GntR family transcriptional regulator [Reyranella sp. CPCC 100927]|uniref:GntR family transcriptional regulator n=1 Tax=Reyranella sp. CPCC 100927 TaxID=2599616 RepID=UPI0011B54D30|nr:GntR family transcriptional regulator [Reyranella sp. CPCC 100927]TWT14103.1 GntR family transcriptional regulator [Reyranella sp. CPCC 100927]
MQSTELERVTLLLRQMIMSGEFEPGARIAEIPLASRLGVSRTPVRLALGILEQEGLLTSAPHKGFCVREITIDEIADAFDVRGALEALACQRAVERGLDTASRIALEECLALGDALVAKGALTEVDTRNWSEMNARFHDTIVAASRNAPLASALAFVGRLPLVSPGAIAFTQGLEAAFQNMQKVQAEHRDIVEALVNGQASRAASLVQEHAYKSREKLRRGLERLRGRRIVSNVPGLKLVVG